MSPPEIPRIDQPPPGAPPRAVQFRTNSPAPAPRGWRGFLGRRGFLAVLGAGAMTLGLTVLGWIPLARPARAEEGTEWPDCGSYDYGPDHGPNRPMCVGAPYSNSYCGPDNWFMTGCYDQPDGRVCYEPASICRADPQTHAGRNAWRWVRNNLVYRCADGHALHEGAPNPEVLICLARLTGELQPSTTPSPPSSPPPSSPPPSSPPPSSSPPTAEPPFEPWLHSVPQLPEIPLLSSLPLPPPSR